MKIAIIGLGYVGLPLAITFSKNYTVIGYDISAKRVQELKIRNDITCETNEAELQEYLDSGSKFTLDVNELKEASVFIITVPTPVDEKNQPDLGPLIEATQSVAKNLKRGDYVIYESTVFPGTTNTMSTNEARSESQKIPLGRRRFNNLVCIDVHSIKNF